MKNNTFQPIKIGIYYQVESGICFRIYYHKVEKIRIWPNPYAVEKISNLPYWRSCRPVITIPKEDIEEKINRLNAPIPFENDQYLLALETQAEKRKRNETIQKLKWYALIPPKIRLTVQLFPNRQFQMLSLIANCGPAALDLAMSNHALAYLLGSNWIFTQDLTKSPLAVAKVLLRPNVKQVDIQRHLGFPPKKTVRQILRHIVPDAINVSSLLNLREALQKASVINSLSHLKRINASIIKIVCDPALLELVSYRLIAEISKLKKDDKVAHTAFKLYRIFKFFRQINLNPNRYPLINSIKKLMEIHDELDYKMRKFAYHKTSLTFPAPPIKGTTAIIPLTNAGEIIKEGYQQKNCAADYLNQIIKHKDYYLYKVLSPERCTLSLIKNDGKWEQDQIKKSCNQETSKDTKAYVESWLQARQKQIEKHA